MRTSTRRAAALAALCILLLAGCATRARESGDRLQVVATTTQIGDWARAVGGDAVDLHQILHPNTDPHEYEPRPSDVQAAAGARVVLYNGDGLDGWIAKLVAQAGGTPARVDLGAAVPVRIPGDRSGAQGPRYDAHWWQDPVNVEAAVRRIAGAFAAAEPSRRRTFAANAAAYLTKLRRLDARVRACLARVPAGRRRLVTDHDAFGYFARRYGIEVVGAVIPSQSTQAQPSAGEVSRLVDLIRRKRVRAVFPESSISPKLARAIARQTGASASYELYGDTLGPRGSPGATYLGMVAANADAMARGFSDGAARCRVRAG
jgi:ABC-type Zn uptake system ZnuABC Zn-binding protein ZnuA